MVTAVRDGFGEDSTTATAASEAQILRFLNKRQRELCADSNVLVSGWTTSTIASQEWYSVPPEYTSVEAIRIYRTTGDGAKWWLSKVTLVETDPGLATGTPTRFGVWGLNVSTDNSPAFKLNPIPVASGTNDLVCYGRQLPKTMVSGAQGPEVRARWQDAVVDGAIADCFMRVAEGSREALAMADRYSARWEAHKRAAIDYITLDIYSPQNPRDTMGYTTQAWR
jgi:hypothetical protein